MSIESLPPYDNRRPHSLEPIYEEVKYKYERLEAYDRGWEIYRESAEEFRHKTLAQLILLSRFDDQKRLWAAFELPVSEVEQLTNFLIRKNVLLLADFRMAKEPDQSAQDPLIRIIQNEYIAMSDQIPGRGDGKYSRLTQDFVLAASRQAYLRHDNTLPMPDNLAVSMSTLAPTFWTDPDGDLEIENEYESLKATMSSSLAQLGSSFGDELAEASDALEAGWRFYRQICGLDPFAASAKKG